jgi:hypothetical protein
MRWIVDGAWPTDARAIERDDQCVVRGRRLQRSLDRFGNRLIADLTRHAGTRLIVEARHPMLGEPPPSFSYSIGRGAHPQADVLVLPGFCWCSTMRARCARPCAVLRRDAMLLSSRRSLRVKSIAAAVLPTAEILRASAQRIAH